MNLGISDSWRPLSADHHSHDGNDVSRSVGQREEWDSDDELDSEMATALFECGRSKLTERDFKEAESCFGNAISMIADKERIMVVSNDMAKTKLNAMSGLITALKEQSKWDDAQRLLRERISVLSGQKTSDYGDPILDTLLLAEVLLCKGDYTEALLYGRRAYKAFQRKGPARRQESENSLVLLVEVCRVSRRQTE